MISEELGDGDNPAEESEEYREKILALQLPEETSNKLLKECAKLAKMPYGSHEATVSRNYLDTCLSLPWNTLTKDSLDLSAAAVYWIAIITAWIRSKSGLLRRWPSGSFPAR